MLFLRIVLVVFVLGWLVLTAVRMIRDGKATLRGGVAISRKKTPVNFWASVIVTFLFIGLMLKILFGLIGKMS